MAASAAVKERGLSSHSSFFGGLSEKSAKRNWLRRSTVGVSASNWIARAEYFLSDWAKTRKRPNRTAGAAQRIKVLRLIGSMLGKLDHFLRLARLTCQGSRLRRASDILLPEGFRL